MPSTYFYAVRVEELPEGFRAEITRLKLAQKGVWETNAPNATVAEQQIIRFVRMLTREVIEPGLLQVKRTTALLKEITAAPPVEALPVPEIVEIVEEPVVETVVEPVVEAVAEPETALVTVTIVPVPGPAPAPKRSRRWIDWLLGRKGWWALSTKSSEAGAAASTPS